jgi:NAD(P)-dependent dehydrogenase (short-subunit alcohol dehydrogenase family)
MSKLLGKVAVVTGASKGIGAGIAKALAAEGASVVVNYSTPGFAVSNQKRESERILALNTRHLRREKFVSGVWDNLPSFQRALNLAFSGQGESQATRCPQKRETTHLLLVE